MPIINNSDIQSPFPTFGELYRILANALDVNQKQVAEIGRFAREGDYDWSIPKNIINVIEVHLKNYLDQDFSDYLSGDICASHEIYMELVLNTQVDALNRPELAVLLKDELANSIYITLQGVAKHWHSPDLKLFTSPDHISFKVVLDWIQITLGTEVDLIKYVYPDATSQKEKRRNIERWCSGEHLPDISSINIFAKELSDRLHAAQYDDKKCIELIDSLKRWLLLARVLAELCIHAAKFRIELKKLLQELCEGEPETHYKIAFEKFIILLPKPQLSLLFQQWSKSDVMPSYLQLILDTINLENQKQGQRLFELQEPRHKMLKVLDRNEYFVDEAKKNTLVCQLEELKEFFLMHDSDGRTYYELERIYGRYHLLCGDFEQASHHYDKAIRLAWYRAGQAIKPFFEEVLYFYAHIDKTVRLKQLRNRGIALGLLKPPVEGDKINFTDEELNKLKVKFMFKFPNVARIKYASK